MVFSVRGWFALFWYLICVGKYDYKYTDEGRKWIIFPGSISF